MQIYFLIFKIEQKELVWFFW